MMLVYVSGVLVVVYELLRLCGMLFWLGVVCVWFVMIVLLVLFGCWCVYCRVVLCWGVVVVWL